MAGRRVLVDLGPLRASRDFRLVFSAVAITRVGSLMTLTAVPYQVAVLTRDPVAVGLLGAVELVPILATALLGGALADFVDRRRLVLASEAGLLALTALLLVNSLVGAPRRWPLYVVAGLAAGLAGLQRPALEGITARIVEPDQIPAAAALTALTATIGSLAGPAAAGVVIAAAGMPTVFGIDLMTFAASLVCLAAAGRLPPPQGAPKPSLRAVGAGLRYAASRPELLGTYLVDFSAMVLAAPFALFPFLADRFGGPAVLGLLSAAPAVGSLLAASVSGWTARVRRDGLAVLLGAAGWGVGIVGAGLARSLWAVLACLVAAGACDMVSGLFRMTIWNQTVPDRLRGRLGGVEMISYTSGPLLGNVRAGLAGRWLGITGSIAVGGVLCVAAVALLAAVLPGFRRFDRREGIAAKQAADRAAAGDVPAADRVAVDDVPAGEAAG